MSCKRIIRIAPDPCRESCRDCVRSSRSPGHRATCRASRRIRTRTQAHEVAAFLRRHPCRHRTRRGPNLSRSRTQSARPPAAMSTGCPADAFRAGPSEPARRLRPEIQWTSRATVDPKVQTPPCDSTHRLFGSRREHARFRRQWPCSDHRSSLPSRRPNTPAFAQIPRPTLFSDLGSRSCCARLACWSTYGGPISVRKGKLFCSPLRQCFPRMTAVPSVGESGAVTTCDAVDDLDRVGRSR